MPDPAPDLNALSGELQRGRAYADRERRRREGVAWILVGAMTGLPILAFVLGYGLNLGFDSFLQMLLIILLVPGAPALLLLAFLAPRLRGLYEFLDPPRTPRGRFVTFSAAAFTLGLFPVWLSIYQQVMAPLLVGAFCWMLSGAAALLLASRTRTFGSLVWGTFVLVLTTILLGMAGVGGAPFWVAAPHAALGLALITYGLRASRPAPQEASA